MGYCLPSAALQRYGRCVALPSLPCQSVQCSTTRLTRLEVEANDTVQFIWTPHTTTDSTILDHLFCTIDHAASTRRQLAVQSSPVTCTEQSRPMIQQSQASHLLPST